MTGHQSTGLITAQMFREGFFAEWEAYCRENPRQSIKCYLDDRMMTKLMLGDYGILERAFKRIARGLIDAPTLRFSREWYTVDALIVGGENLIGDGYPSRIEALIEHENGDRWEEEMWKLLHWRAPLKVLIGYDFYNEDYIKPQKATWHTRKLEVLREMYRKVNAIRGEPGTEYLLIVGNRENRDACSAIKWRWCCLEQPDTKLTPFGADDGEESRSVAEAGFA